MERQRYLELLASDGSLLRAAATADLAAAVPWCAGWTARDVLTHVAEVYEHKLACIALAGREPEPWPPDWPPGRDPVEWYDDALGRVLTVLRTTDPAAPSWTWWPADQTAGFWVRRMAQETAVHRVDAQSAAGQPTAIDAELAFDGIDEVLTMFLAGDWSDAPQPDSTGTVVLVTGTNAWHLTMTPERIDLVPRDTEAQSRVTGAASPLLLWLWGRAPETELDLAGDHAVIERLRARLAIATQ
ncbi:MAG: hypothetical protein QOG49_982 [Frankiaceae bacterium]|nr:hypothetical protein [Frankiaceae bacterium]